MPKAVVYTGQFPAIFIPFKNYLAGRMSMVSIVVSLPFAAYHWGSFPTLYKWTTTTLLTTFSNFKALQPQFLHGYFFSQIISKAKANTLA